MRTNTRVDSLKYDYNLNLRLHVISLLFGMLIQAQMLWIKTNMTSQLCKLCTGREEQDIDIN